MLPSTILGTDGNDHIFRQDVDVFSNPLHTADEIIQTLNGKDTIFDGFGNDLVEGGADRDQFYAGAGADTYVGGAGRDQILYGGQSALHEIQFGEIWLADQGIVIDAVDGSNSTGIAAGDVLQDIERLFATSGSDTIQAASGMQVFGGLGDDIIGDATGSERLIGGEGADQFSLGSDQQMDRIGDFVIGEDMLDISAWGATSFDQLSFSSDGKGARIFIQYEGEILRLDGYTEDDIPGFSTVDFVFAAPPEPEPEPVVPTGYGMLAIDMDISPLTDPTGPIDANGDGLNDVVLGSSFYGYSILSGNAHNDDDFWICASCIDDGGPDGYYHVGPAPGYFLDTLDLENWGQPTSPLVGDINGDGYVDFVDYPRTNDLGRHLIVKFGGADGVEPDANALALDGSDGFTMSLTGAGGPNFDFQHGVLPQDIGNIEMRLVDGNSDLNGDGNDDLLISSTWSYEYDGTFVDYEILSTGVIYGQSDGAFTPHIALHYIQPEEGTLLESYITDFFPDPNYTAYSVGDISGDGIADVVVSNFTHASYLGGNYADQTEYHVFLGGFSTEGPDYVIQGTFSGADPSFSGFVNQIGDFNGDGINDLYLWEEGEAWQVDYLLMGGENNLDALDAADGVQDGVINVTDAHYTSFVPTPVTERLYGTDGEDVFGPGNPASDGSEVNDSGQVFLTGDGRDVIWDGAGDDTVIGGADRDVFVAGGGADSYDGAGGHDILTYQNSDTGLAINAIDGSQGSGTAQGDAITDIERLHGTNYNDAIQAADGMRLHGLAGDDILSDAAGSERLIGGDGADQFNLSQDGAIDRISDFVIGEDTLDISAWGVTSFDQLEIYSDGKGSRLFIEFEGERLRLDGYSADDIHLFEGADFVFAEPSSAFEALMLPADGLESAPTVEEEEPEFEDILV